MTMNPKIDRDQFVTLSGISYIEFFKAISNFCQPTSYFEIGTETGKSTAQFNCATICVDPFFKVSEDIVSNKPELHQFQMTSDAFFRKQHLSSIFPAGPDVLFLDGMHWCEFLFRDFINAERHCHSRSMVILHDCMPQNKRMAKRTHEIGDETESDATRYAWTGDVWKVVPILQKYRPDLEITLVDCPPSGLVIIQNLDSGSETLSKNYFDIVEEMRNMEFDASPFELLTGGIATLSSRKLLEHPENFTQHFSIW